MAFSLDGAPAPTIVNSSVERTREYLTGPEVEKLMEAARKSSRYGHRDATMILSSRVACDGESALEIRLRFVRLGPCQRNLTGYAVDLSFAPTFLGRFHHRHRFIYDVPSLIKLVKPFMGRRQKWQIQRQKRCCSCRPQCGDPLCDCLDAVECVFGENRGSSEHAS
jgi:hypothetical protein